MKQARRRALKTKGHRRVSFRINHERYLDHRDRDAPVEPKIALGEPPLTNRRPQRLVAN
jgi:hypothetical protein